jgi:hypothetical protein
MIESFKAGAHLYIDKFPYKNNDVEWLAIMQHHGTPTRLLDVTFSPYIALYFALEKGNEECCVFAFNHTELSKIDKNSVDSKDFINIIFENRTGAQSFIIAYEPKMKNQRMLAQQGLFLIPSNINEKESFRDILGMYGLHGKCCKRYLISPSLRYDGLVRLKKMNITSTSLFPGLDGFCRSIGFEVIESMPRILPIE